MKFFVGLVLELGGLKPQTRSTIISATYGTYRSFVFCCLGSGSRLPNLRAIAFETWGSRGFFSFMMYVSFFLLIYSIQSHRQVLHFRGILSCTPLLKPGGS